MDNREHTDLLPWTLSALVLAIMVIAVSYASSDGQSDTATPEAHNSAAAAGDDASLPETSPLQSSLKARTPPDRT